MSESPTNGRPGPEVSDERHFQVWFNPGYLESGTAPVPAYERMLWNLSGEILPLVRRLGEYQADEQRPGKHRRDDSTFLRQRQSDLETVWKWRPRLKVVRDRWCDSLSRYPPPRSEPQLLLIRLLTIFGYELDLEQAMRSVEYFRTSRRGKVPPLPARDLSEYCQRLVTLARGTGQHGTFSHHLTLSPALETFYGRLARDRVGASPLDSQTLLNLFKSNSSLVFGRDPVAALRTGGTSSFAFASETDSSGFLTTLDLMGLTLKEISSITRFPRLQVLKLGLTEVTSLAPLIERPLPSLRHLDIQCCPVTYDEQVTFAELHPACALTWTDMGETVQRGRQDWPPNQPDPDYEYPLPRLS